MTHFLLESKTQRENINDYYSPALWFIHCTTHFDKKKRSDFTSLSCSLVARSSFEYWGKHLRSKMLTSQTSSFTNVNWIISRYTSIWTEVLFNFNQKRITKISEKYWEILTTPVVVLERFHSYTVVIWEYLQFPKRIGIPLFCHFYF